MLVFLSLLKLCFVIFPICSAPSLERCEILLGPEVTYGPPGLSLTSPVAMTIAHCAEVIGENWNVRLKKKTKDDEWEVRGVFPSLLSRPRLHLKFRLASGVAVFDLSSLLSRRARFRLSLKNTAKRNVCTSPVHKAESLFPVK